MRRRRVDSALDKLGSQDRSLCCIRLQRILHVHDCGLRFGVIFADGYFCMTIHVNSLASAAGPTKRHQQEYFVQIAS
jgi:hypothetical protein